MAEEAQAEGSYGKVLLGVTPKGKEIFMVRHYGKTIRFIEFGSGGQIPECLGGGFSSIRDAQKAADSYLLKIADKTLTEDSKSTKK